MVKMKAYYESWEDIPENLRDKEMWEPAGDGFRLSVEDSDGWGVANLDELNSTHHRTAAKIRAEREAFKKEARKNNAEELIAQKEALEAQLEELKTGAGKKTAEISENAERKIRELMDANSRMEQEFAKRESDYKRSLHTTKIATELSAHTAHPQFNEILASKLLDDGIVKITDDGLSYHKPNGDLWEVMDKDRKGYRPPQISEIVTEMRSADKYSPFLKSVQPDGAPAAGTPSVGASGTSSRSRGSMGDAGFDAALRNAGISIL